MQRTTSKIRFAFRLDTPLGAPSSELERPNMICWDEWENT